MKEEIMEYPREEDGIPSEPNNEHLKDILETGYQEILEIAEKLRNTGEFNIKGGDISSSEIKEEMTNNDKIIKVLEVGSIIDRRIMLINLFLIPILKSKNEENDNEDELKKAEGSKILDEIKDQINNFEVTIEDTEKKEDNELENEGTKELKQALKEIIEKSDLDIRSIDRIADLIGEYAKKISGTKGKAVTIVSSVLKNEGVQKIISDKFRGFLEKKEEDEQGSEIAADNVI